jgi:hypothetical protein
MERCKVLENLRTNLHFPEEFVNKPSYERQKHMIRLLLQHSPKNRPSAIEILRRYHLSLHFEKKSRSQRLTLFDFLSFFSIPDSKLSNPMMLPANFRLVWNMKALETHKGGKEQQKVIDGLTRELDSKQTVIEELRKQNQTQKEEIERLKMQLAALAPLKN